MLIVKQCLQLLDTLCFSLKNKAMLMIRHCLQILGAIIISNAIQVMNYPTLGQRLIMSLFPYKNVFQNIAIFGSWMLRFAYANISLAISYATLPIVACFASRVYVSRWGRVRPCFLGGTTPTKLRTSRLPAFFTGMLPRKVFISFPLVPMPFIFIWHNLIITYLASRCKQRDNISSHIDEVMAVVE